VVLLCAIVVIGIVVLLAVVCMLYMFAVLPVFVNCSDGVVVFYVVAVDAVVGDGGVGGCCGD